MEQEEMEFNRMKGALLALNAAFEAAKLGNSGRSLAASLGEIQCLLALAEAESSGE